MKKNGMKWNASIRNTRKELQSQMILAPEAGHPQLGTEKYVLSCAGSTKQNDRNDKSSMLASSGDRDGHDTAASDSTRMKLTDGYGGFACNVEIF